MKVAFLLLQIIMELPIYGKNWTMSGTKVREYKSIT